MAKRTSRAKQATKKKSAAATKKAAKKKPAPKKKPAAKKQPAAKKKPAAKKQKKQPAARKKTPAEAPATGQLALADMDQTDFMRMDGMNVLSREERAEAITAAGRNPLHARVEKEMLDAFRLFYPSPGTPESDATILGTDPNNFDVDPGPFYEYVEERFGVPQDPAQSYFGGLGGTIRDTIAFLTPRWDGTLHPVMGAGGELGDDDEGD